MKRKNLHFADEQACIADVKSLRAGNEANGQWTFPQACWHVDKPIKFALRPPAETEPTPEQKKAQGFLDSVNASGWPDKQLPSPPTMVPPADAGPQAIDDFVKDLDQLAAYPSSHVDMGVFGPVEIGRCRRFILNHAAHHLSFFEPTS